MRKAERLKTLTALVLVAAAGYLLFHPEYFRTDSPSPEPLAVEQPATDSQNVPRFLHRIDCQGRTPLALAFHNGRLYVSYRGLNLIDILDAQGQREGYFDAYPNGRIEAVGLAWDDEGRLYVADGLNRSILRFDSEHRFIGPFPPHRATPGQPEFVAAPVGVSVYQNITFISDFAASSVKLFSLEGAFLLEVSDPSDQNAGPWHPFGIATSGDGRFFVADLSSGRIAVFGCDGRFAHFFDQPAEKEQSIYPGGIAIDDQGRAHVSDGKGRRVLMYDNRGRFLQAYGENGKEGERLKTPLAMAADTERGLVFIADPGKKTIDVWSTN